MEWFKGAGGGLSDSSLFEGWWNEKLEQYNVDPDTYDYTNITARPSILTEGYCRQRIPFLTLIFLWDKNVDFLLSLRHDNLTIGVGKPVMDQTSDTARMISSKTLSGSTKSKAKKKNMEATIGGLEDMMKNIIALCKSGSNKNEFKDNNREDDTLLLENFPLSELCGLIDQHQNPIKLPREMGMLSEEKKMAIINEIEIIFTMVNKISINKKRSAV